MKTSDPMIVPPVPAPSPIPSLPPLETGDRLSRAEFERRYEAMPHLKKAELIEGVVYVPSPTRHRRHGKPQTHLTTWLGAYEAQTPGVEASGNSTVRLDLDNEPQPDGLLIILPECGGRVTLTEDDYLEGGPELAAEVAASWVSIDLGLKLHVYRRNGVQEYLVWRVLDQQVDWFRLREGEYHRLQPDANGIVRSEIFPGLWLDVPALLQGDLKRVLATLDQGTSQPEHTAFVQELQRRKTAQ